VFLALDQEAASQIAGAQLVLERELGGDLRGIHLFGSALDGGLKPCSDLDLMVSVARPPPKAVQRALLRELLSHSAWPGSSRVLRALEVTLVSLSELVPWRYPPRREMQFGEWLREDIRAGRYEPARPDHDLAILITKLHRHSVALFGPPAGDLFEDVPVSDFRQSLADTISQWNAPSDWSGHERDVILALARIWYSARTGEITSKERAAAWAADRLPAEHRVLVERAAKAYLGGKEDVLAGTLEEVARTIAFCKGEVERELGRHG
jgi:streptomycin 3"-adenylyltransferase